MEGYGPLALHAERKIKLHLSASIIFQDLQDCLADFSIVLDKKSQKGVDVFEAVLKKQNKYDGCHRERGPVQTSRLHQLPAS
jgi:hypothetical protein